LSVADFANHIIVVYSWAAWAFYGFAIATKGSKAYSHLSLILQVFTRCAMVQSGALVAKRNSSTHLYFANLWCIPTVDSRTAQAAAHKL